MVWLFKDEEEVAPALQERPKIPSNSNVSMDFFPRRFGHFRLVHSASPPSANRSCCVQMSHKSQKSFKKWRDMFLLGSVEIQSLEFLKDLATWEYPIHHELDDVVRGDSFPQEGRKVPSFHSSKLSFQHCNFPRTDSFRIGP